MGKKLYVGNLSWNTTEGSLQEAFSQAGSVVSAQIPLNDMGKSRGFGFVEMSTDEEAAAAITMFHDKELDGRVLRVNEAGQGGAAAGGGAVNNKKLFVGGLAWTTNEDSLMGAFSQAGSVVSVKIPLNDMGKSRGIGFVEMATDEEAQTAISMFHEKELDGRMITVNVARPMQPRPRGGNDRFERGGDRNDRYDRGGNGGGRSDFGGGFSQY